MRIDYDALTDPIFLFIYWLVAGTLWVIIPLPPPAPAAAAVPEPPAQIQPLEPPPELEAAVQSLTSQLDSLQIELDRTQEERFDLEQRVRSLDEERLRLQGELSRTSTTIQTLDEERKNLQRTTQLNAQQQREVEARMEKELAEQIGQLQQQLGTLQAKEKRLAAELAKAGPAVQTESILLTPRAINATKMPFLVEIINNRVSTVTRNFFDIEGGLFHRGPRLAKRKKPGETVAEIVKAGSAYRKAFENLDAEKHYISIMLNADSFEAFRAARKVAWEQGFDVGWLPTDTSGGEIELFKAKYVENIEDVDPTKPIAAPILK